jgi:uncharacterized protein YndB with AHSA1/START domain
MSKPQFVYTTLIRTSPDKLWDAIINPEFTRQYWGNMENHSDWRPGSKWEHRNPGDKQDPVWITGRVVESDRPRRLVLTWADPENLTDESRVTFEITQIEDLTQLTVIHGEFTPGSSMAPKVQWGWPRVLSSLKSFLETGKGFDIMRIKKASGESPCGG